MINNTETQVTPEETDENAILVEDRMVQMEQLGTGATAVVNLDEKPPVPADAEPIPADGERAMEI